MIPHLALEQHTVVLALYPLAEQLGHGVQQHPQVTIENRLEVDIHEGLWHPFALDLGLLMLRAWIIEALDGPQLVLIKDEIVHRRVDLEAGMWCARQHYCIADVPTGTSANIGVGL